MVIMEDDDVFEAFANRRITTKKFQFKKVEKSSSSTNHSNSTDTTSPFFKNAQKKTPENDNKHALPRKVTPYIFETDPLKTKLEHIFNDEKITKAPSKVSPSKDRGEKLARLFGDSSSNISSKSVSKKLCEKLAPKRFETPFKKEAKCERMAPIFNFHKSNKNDTAGDRVCSVTSVGNTSQSFSVQDLSSTTNTSDGSSRGTSKFNFKKKSVAGIPRESIIDLFCESQTSTDLRKSNFDVGVTSAKTQTNTAKQVSSNISSSTSVNLNQQSDFNDDFNKKQFSKFENDCDNESLQLEGNSSSNNIKSKDCKQDTEISDFMDSPIKPKKFVFKKISSSSGSTTPSLDLSPLNSPLRTKKESPRSKKYIHKSITLAKHDSHISISSDDFDLNESTITPNKATKPSEKPLLDDAVPFVSQSLQTTEGDYMDDEEFERLFGEGSKPTELEKPKVTADDFDLSDINWNEKIEAPMNVADVLADISDVNWSEDIFAQESYTPPDAFKDRVDDAHEFKRRYHFSDTMDEVLHQKFGLRDFRPQQREIINASLNRHDCFVLMPTGGGKSLCYQLPAILSEGVTIVISPLRALISDQVDKLNALDICAAHLCSDVSREDSALVFSKLHCREPIVKLLYLTPEKINASNAVIDLLTSLYQRGKLARFVIDEAHCLSQWGHDFRPDYKQLFKLREQYRDVPIMCLTATATKQVETDVINTLKLTKVKRFIMSFNRPNIKYQVIPKTGKFATAEIVKLIKSKFFRKSGIIYCLARNDCDTIAEELNSNGIMTRPYHAGMNDKVREAIQREWMQDRFYVIVATIAFGMGIDKPDVRFVIHNSIPKSVEAFYQESGRAGRDGEISYSYLFYNYTDVLRLQKIMQLEKSNKKTMDGHNNNLKQMVSFAENVVDCRRYLQLLHLGEKFDRNICIRNKDTTCDNCENINRYTEIDVTKQAKELGTLVKDLSARDITLIQIADTYKGSKAKLIIDRKNI
ncbi:unnamed protein product [Callosobruchus maculatus]|uniref:ATP-dependent DNA helicase n=1 Tax=Callosobruchus maculatus TaxID=64391 RepID=A0A653BW29_CALMS|nr:unnamed protein product [Callosobruchus maculatus]